MLYGKICIKPLILFSLFDPHFVRLNRGSVRSGRGFTPAALDGSSGGLGRRGMGCVWTRKGGCPASRNEVCPPPILADYAGLEALNRR